MLLNMIVVGPQRTGTSWIDRALRTSDKFLLPKDCKETFYFDSHFQKSENWYFKKYFLGEVDTESKILAEVSPTYFNDVAALRRIKLHNNAIKVIICLRHPVERAWSLYKHEIAKGRISENIPFRLAAEQNPWLLESGRYSYYAPLWEKEFGSQNVMYVCQALIESNPEKVFKIIHDFSGAPTRERLDLELSGKYGAATVPRFPLLAKYAAILARLLRKKGLHNIVEMAKRAGLKKIYSGGDAEKLNMPDDVKIFLQCYHKKDIIFFNEKLNSPKR